MTIRLPWTAAVCAAIVLAGRLLAAQAALVADPLRPIRAVSGNILTSPADPALRIRVDPAFRYVGGQRFVLRGIADAEQHAFVDAAGGTIRRLYWIQFEQFLPGKGGDYAYDDDAPMTVWALNLRAHVRRFTDAPAPDSDRRRLYDLLERAGFDMPAAAVRARLVHVPENDRRRELMLIYLEPFSGDDPPPADLIARAIAGLTITR